MKWYLTATLATLIHNKWTRQCLAAHSCITSSSCTMRSVQTVLDRTSCAL